MRNSLIAKLGVVLGVLFMASTASAVSTYSDVLGPQDLGYVSVGNPLGYDHSFTPPSIPNGTPANVSKVTLSILITDIDCLDYFSCRYDLHREAEWAVITVEGTEIFNDEVNLFNLEVNNVTLAANILAVGDSFGVDISATEGDFVVLYSVADFEFTTGAGGSGGNPGTPMPEPSSAIVFGVGLLVLSRRLRS